MWLRCFGTVRFDGSHFGSRSFFAPFIPDPFILGYIHFGAKDGSFGANGGSFGINGILLARTAVLSAATAVLSAPTAVISVPTAVLSAPMAVLSAPKAVLLTATAVLLAPVFIIPKDTFMQKLSDDISVESIKRKYTLNILSLYSSL